MQDVELSDYLKQLLNSIPNVDFLVSGRQVFIGDEKLSDLDPRIKIFEEFKDFKLHI
jgi:hypothetical protein